VNRNTTLIAGCVGLALALIAEWFLFAPSSNPRLPAPTAGLDIEVPSAEGADFQLPAIEQFAETVERPLFSESRRPGPKDAPAGETAQTPPEAPSQLKLSAVVLAPGHQIAVLKNNATGKLQRVNKGEEWNGWMVKEVRHDSAVLNHQGEEQILKLIREPGPKTPTPPTAPTTSPKASIEALKRATSERARLRPAQPDRPGAPAQPPTAPPAVATPPAAPPPSAAAQPAPVPPPPPPVEASDDEEIIEDTE
jgi:hypothetical protein